MPTIDKLAHGRSLSAEPQPGEIDRNRNWGNAHSYHLIEKPNLRTAISTYYVPQYDQIFHMVPVLQLVTRRKL